MIQVFMFCFVAGFLIAGLGLFPSEALANIGLFGPIGATIAYAVIGYVRGFHRKPSLVEKFADNCYYLGFIFTQAALLFAFLPITLFDRQIGSPELLRFFGMAIGAALAGLIARTWFIQTSLTSPEADDVIHHEVEALAKEIGNRARQIHREFEGIATKIAELPAMLGEKLEGQVNSISQGLALYDSAIRAGVTQLEGVAAEVESQAGKTARGVDANQELLAEQVRNVAVSLGQLHASMTESVQASVEHVRSSARSLASGVSALEELRTLAPGVEQLQTQFADMNQVAGRVSIASDELASRLESAALNVGERLSEVSTAATARIEAAVQDAGSKLGDTAAQASSRIEAAAHDAGSRLGDTAAQASSRIETAANEAVSYVAGSAGEIRSQLIQRSEQFEGDISEAVKAFSVILAEFQKQLAKLRVRPEEDK